ncbi:glycosyltransferase [Stutzerimonas xanthomarina]|uniref:Alpha-1,3-rhamnosyltransferase n=2 Tax=Stutzerimonas xanthomarina TaxID=271420 RepID=A0A1M5KNB4_9GAMM|nr:glycosyltransferase [Stutzerimonas xanthomarina]MCP9337213.1 glycosyltransferase [Stutzerimonas xanthomarina]SEI07388.1 alpha-1,3-rhamnosyltransferase [Stutzerimonas xanthomarina]SHG54251.1 alpha-1,3-rhamnosyltransferase [Stutzerimonas xanthomarina DSM 18231]
MSNLPLVSVIIASYNHAPYVEESILSVLEQTYPNIELLVVDDGSSDDSVERIQRLQLEHGFSFLVQPNQGLSRTLNDCIARAKGDLIAPLGSDDVMLPERIATQVAYMNGKPEVGICAGNVLTIDAQGNTVQKRFRERVFRRLDFDAMFNAVESGPPAPTLLFRREALQAVGGFDPEIRLEDLQVELKIAHAGYFIDVLNDVMAKYRVHGANTYKNRRFMVEQVMATYRCFADHPDYDRACAKFLNSMFLKCAKSDPVLARELLSNLPLRHWNTKTVRGLGRLLLG